MPALNINQHNIQFDYRAYVTSDGSYHARAAVITFDPEALTTEQWETLSNLHDDDRYGYVSAIIHGDEKEIAQYEEEL